MDPQCVLCEHNPHRRCNVNFAPKYLVNDVLKAKCEAPIRVEIIDRSTGVPVGEDIPDVHLEVSVVLLTVCCAVSEHTRGRRAEHRQLGQPAIELSLHGSCVSHTGGPQYPFRQAGFGRAAGPRDWCLVPCFIWLVGAHEARRQKHTAAACMPRVAGSRMVCVSAMHTATARARLPPQMAILDGNAYDAKCLEAGQERDEDLESCSLLLNNKGTALLQPGASASHSAQHKVVVQLQVRRGDAIAHVRRAHSVCRGWTAILRCYRLGPRQTCVITTCILLKLRSSCPHTACPRAP